jgi:lambda repressor-like predicted transcriptional regulator
MRYNRKANEVNMMLKSFLKENKISMYRLSADSGVPYSTLNDLVNRKLPVENLKSGQLYALAESLEMTMNELYDMCRYACQVYSEKYHIPATVTVRHKIYCLSFQKDGETYEDEILPVKREATRCIETLALWKLEEHLSELEMEAAYETLLSKKTR